MSVVSSTLLRHQRSGNADSKYRRTYTVVYRVVTDDRNDGWTTVLVQSGNVTPNPVPNLWTTFNLGGDVDTGVYLQSKSGQQVDGNDTLWDVTCEWSAPKPGSGNSSGQLDPGTQQNNPLNRPTRYHVEWANFSRPAIKDINDSKIVNSAGSPFDPPIEIDDARPVLVASKNLWPLGSIIAQMIDFKNAVNTDVFYGAGPREAKVESITAGEMQIENGVAFYEVTYRIQFNNDTWDMEILDLGFMHFDDAGNLIDAREGAQNADGTYVDPTSSPVSEPIGLNADGTRLASGLDKLFIEPPFRVYPERNFAVLGI